LDCDRKLISTGANVMATHTQTHGLELWELAAVWFSMMTAMMVPTAWPWVVAFHRFNGATVAATARFAFGYLLAWSAYAIVAAACQRVLQMTMLISMADAAVVPRVGAVIFLIAGLYQFAPVKRACLTHCRTPLGYFLTRWHNRPMSALRIGLHHGLFCIGCCWALMATAFAVGVMNTWWMAALGALAFTEQVAPFGEIVRRMIGCAFLVAAITRAGAL
jgi:predicted metal-binding membrane protein